MPSFEYSYCPECQKWVPSDKMHYVDGIKVCDWCLNQIPTPDEFVHDATYGKVRCIWCDSYDTEDLGTIPKKYKCRECGEEFIE